MNFIDLLKNEEKTLQDSIQSKLESGKELTDHEVRNYKLTEDDKLVLEAFKRIKNGEKIKGFELTDFLATPQAKVLIPKVLIGDLERAAEPVYLASKFFKKIKMKSGNATYFPSIGATKAYDVAEGQEIPQQTIDWQTSSNNLIKVGKAGVRLQFTQELIDEAEWDIVKIMSEEAGRALARHKEQKAFIQMASHGFKVFDNKMRSSIPEAGTTGRDYEDNLNDTLSIDDLLDMLIALYNNGYTPSDLLVHPLAWVMFSKNGLTGSLTAMTNKNAKEEAPNASFKIGPESMQGRIPFAFNVNLSPFAPINKKARTFDMVAVDGNNVGVEIQKSSVKPEEFNDPARDLLNLKLTERYGHGVFDDGKAIVSAKNISLARSFPRAQRVKNV